MVLVTGATGHVGNVLVRELLSRNEKIRALVYPGEETRSLDGLAVEKMEGDILDPETARRAVRGVNRVFHLAGLIAIDTEHDALVNQVNVEGTRNIAGAARDQNVEKFVYVSSIHAFARRTDQQVIDESFPFDPDNPAGVYDRSKAKASILVRDLVESGLNAVIVCPTGVIGPSDYRHSELGSTVASWTRPIPQIMIEGSFDFVDVRDLAHGLVLASLHGRVGETYILSGSYIRMRDLCKGVQKAAGVKLPCVVVPTWLARGAVRVLAQRRRVTGKRSSITLYSIETVQDSLPVSRRKAENELGYSARPISESIRDTVTWWRSGEALDSSERARRGEAIVARLASPRWTVLIRRWRERTRLLLGRFLPKVPDRHAP